VLVQMAIGVGKVEVIALAALGGAVVNLPLSYALTLRLGVAGVIWGTVLTTLVSNLLIPGLYCMRALDVRFSTFLKRALGAPMMGAAVLLLATWAFHLVISPELHEGSRLVRLPPFLAHLGVGVVAYLIGYALIPVGRTDLADVLRKLRLV
jgi:O-antigen/teichoic acid export membrane protein